MVDDCSCKRFSYLEYQLFWDVNIKDPVVLFNQGLFTASHPAYNTMTAKQEHCHPGWMSDVVLPGLRLARALAQSVTQMTNWCTERLPVLCDHCD